MATTPDNPEFNLASREQAARIDSLLAGVEQALATAAKAREEAVKVRQDTKFAPWTLIFTGMGAASAFFAAGVAFTKLFGG